MKLPNAVSDEVGLKTSVAEKLIAEGWTRADPLSFSCTAAIASKCYQTAVGPKMAFAYLTTCGDGSSIIDAAYNSEGRNILSTTMLKVPSDMKLEDLESGMLQFCDSVEARIADSYAVRLLEKGSEV